jgi:glycosyltransferase involved in cell wall biosynthesis
MESIPIANMKHPLFSIITVSYNSSKFIRDTIESVLASTFQDFEYIIGDDCSTDNTWEIIEEYNDSRIIKYRNVTNLREYPNRNKAISMAKGEWILFIDGDDLIYSHSLSFIQSQINLAPDVLMLLMKWYRKEFFYPIKISPRDFFLEYYFNLGFLGTAFTNVIFNSRILKKYINDVDWENIRFGDDFLRLRIALEGDCLIITDQLTFWRESTNQVSKSYLNDSLAYLETLENRIYFLQEAKKRDILTGLEHNFILRTFSREYFKFILKECFKLKYANIFRKLKNVGLLINIFNQKCRIQLPFEEYTPDNLLNFSKSLNRLNSK